MFSNVGNKIKTSAKVFCWLGIAISVIVGFVLMVQDEEAAGIGGFLIMVSGSLFSWIGSLLAYGFGQLVENSDILVSQTKNSVSDISQSSAQTQNQNPINNTSHNNTSIHQ